MSGSGARRVIEGRGSKDPTLQRLMQNRVAQPSPTRLLLVGGSALSKKLLFGGSFGWLNFADFSVGGLIGFQVFLQRFD